MKTLNKKSQRVAILLAILAAALYAISTPVSKVMLQVVPPTMVAAFLYLGAGIGVGTMMLVRHERKRPSTEERLHRSIALHPAAGRTRHARVHGSFAHHGCRMLDRRQVKVWLLRQAEIKGTHLLISNVSP